MTGLIAFFGVAEVLFVAEEERALAAVFSKALSLLEDLLVEPVERISSGRVGSLVASLLRPNSISSEEEDLEAEEDEEEEDLGAEEDEEEAREADAERELEALEEPLLLLEEDNALNSPALVMEPFLSIAR